MGYILLSPSHTGFYEYHIIDLTYNADSIKVTMNFKNEEIVIKFLKNDVYLSCDKENKISVEFNSNNDIVLAKKTLEIKYGNSKNLVRNYYYSKLGIYYFSDIISASTISAICFKKKVCGTCIGHLFANN